MRYYISRNTEGKLYVGTTTTSMCGYLLKEEAIQNERMDIKRSINHRMDELVLLQRDLDILEIL